MPNGGADNCANCGFNLNNEGRWGDLSEASGHCTIRHTAIPNPLWTYCKNWHSRSQSPEGPIYCSMYDHGYRRVQWFLSVEPTQGMQVKCAVCGGESSEGIALTLDDGSYGFCGREHYLAWRELRLMAQMRKMIAEGEKAYEEMCETSSPTGHYADAKDYFAEAIRSASELELPQEQRELTARLEHIKSVFRSQFS